MKKLLLFAVLVLAFSATAYSQDVKLDFRASGYIDFRTEWYRWNWSTNFPGAARSGIINVVDVDNRPPQINPATGAVNPATGGAWDKTSAYVDSRLRLKFDAIMGKELSGTIFFEADSSTWGDYPGMAGLNAPARNSYGVWGGDNASLEVKNVYFDVAVPYIPVPTTVRFGLQPFGIRSNMFLYVDAAGITAAMKFDPVQLTMYWAKGQEGKIANGDDSDLYGLALSGKVDTFTLGFYGFYFNMRTYPWLSGFTQPNVQIPYGSTANSVSSKMWWLGAYADGKLGPVNINFDFIYDNGWVDSDSANLNPLADSKVKYSGWASRLKIDFPWEAFNFGLVAHYGSGADASKTSPAGLPGQPVANPGSANFSSKVGSYVVPVGSETGSFNEGEVFTASYINGGFTGLNYSGGGTTMTRGSAGGMWLAKLYAGYKLTPDYKMTFQALYYGDTTKHGNTFGNARDAAGLTLKNNSSIGFELDLINEWQIYKNLNFKFGGGVMWAGDALEFWNGVSNEKPKTPWAIITNLTYSF